MHETKKFGLGVRPLIRQCCMLTLSSIKGPTKLHSTVCKSRFAHNYYDEDKFVLRLNTNSASSGDNLNTLKSCNVAIGSVGGAFGSALISCNARYKISFSKRADPTFSVRSTHASFTLKRKKKIKSFCKKLNKQVVTQ